MVKKRGSSAMATHVAAYTEQERKRQREREPKRINSPVSLV